MPRITREDFVEDQRTYRFIAKHVTKNPGEFDICIGGDWFNRVTEMYVRSYGRTSCLQIHNDSEMIDSTRLDGFDVRKSGTQESILFEMGYCADSGSAYPSLAF